MKYQLLHSKNISDEFAPYDVGVLTEPVNNDPVIEAMGGKVVIARATALGNNDCFAGLSTTLNDVTYGSGNGAANAAFAGHADMPGLFPLVTPTPAAAPTPCGFQEVDGAPWQWWDNLTYGTMANAFWQDSTLTEAAYMCDALLSTPDMSEAKGLAFCDMLDEFFTPRINAALSIEQDDENSGPTVQNIELPVSWSMFSTYMETSDMNMESVLSEIDEDVIIAKNSLGDAYLPEWQFNGVGNVEIGQGYQIKMTSPATLSIAGIYTSQNSVDLSNGWNMIGYLSLDAAAADAVLSGIVENIIIAKNMGDAYLPEWNFNGLGNMGPGEADIK